MAAAKTKRGPMETVCTDIGQRTWEFKIGNYVWQWQERLGLNLFVARTDVGEFKLEPTIYAKNLEHAVMFAQGFSAGLAAGCHPACV